MFEKIKIYMRSKDKVYIYMNEEILFFENQELSSILENLREESETDEEMAVSVILHYPYFLFEEDLLKATDYITNTLQNPSAAHRLVDDIELAIVKRLEMPLSFAPYQSSKIRNHPYYRINVRNFSIFYVVIDDTMEVRRLLYSKRNIDKLIK